MDTAAREGILDWRRRIVDEALTWKGTPYHHKGRVKSVGVDCGGLIYECYKLIVGIPHEPFPDGYPEDWALHKDNNERYLDFIMPYVKQVPAPRIADLMVFKIGRAYAHGTIFIGDGKIVHSFGRTGFGSVVVSNLSKFIDVRTGKLRDHKVFTLEDKWLPSLPQ